MGRLYLAGCAASIGCPRIDQGDRLVCWLSSYHVVDSNCSDGAGGQFSRLLRVVKGARIGPFAQCCLDEALGLSVSPRGVGLSEDLAWAEAFAGGREAF